MLDEKKHLWISNLNHTATWVFGLIVKNSVCMLLNAMYFLFPLSPPGRIPCDSFGEGKTNSAARCLVPSTRQR